MPFVSQSNNTIDDEKQDKGSQSGQSQGQQPPQLSGGGGPAFGGAASTPASASAARTPSSSGSFTNLQSYLNVNKDQPLASDLSGKVSDYGNQAQQNLTKSQDTFNQQVQSNTTKYNPELIQNAIKDPTTAANNQDTYNQIEQQRNAQYKGPQSLNEVQGYNPELGQYAAGLVKQTGSEAGRNALLQQFYNKPGYSSGQQKLDQLILQNAPNSREQFAQLQQTFGGLPAQYQTAQSQATQSAQQAQQDTQNTQQQAFKQLQDALSGRISNLDTAVTTAQKTAADRAKQVQTDLAAHKVTDPTELAALGLNSLGTVNGQVRLFGVDPSQYYIPTAQADINRSTIATPEQQAQIAALAKLNQQDNTYLPTATGKYADNNALYGNFDLNALKNAINSNAAKYDAALHQPLTYDQSQAAGLGVLGVGLDASKFVNSDPSAINDAFAANVAQNIQNYIKSLQNQYGYNQYLNTK